MNNKSIKILLLMIFTFTSYLFPQKLAKVNSTSSVDWRKSQKINVNNISTWIHWDGICDLDKIHHDAGFEFPKGSGKFSFYASGLIWGGKVNDEIRVGGSTYSSSLTPGWVQTDGTPIDTSDLRVRIYKTRKNYLTADLSTESMDEGIPVEEIRNQYKKDAEEWPTEHGAPFDDIDGDGIYTNGIDIPGLPDADQTLWFVANDFDYYLSQSAFCSNPSSIELQTTVWAYDAPTPLYNSIFKKYILINKGNDTLKDFYVGMWSDPDIGDARDDFVGCDTSLSLAYCYNGNISDTSYNYSIPACGFYLLQGPVKDSVGYSAYYKGKIVRDKIDLGMTSFTFQLQGLPYDPPPECYSSNYYNALRGRIPYTGVLGTNPVTGHTTNYWLSGDPLHNIGWIDGIIHRPGDRKMYMSSGPFNFAPGDTQEVIYVQMAAQGSDRLLSVALLKGMAFQYVTNYPDYKFVIPKPKEVIPEYFYLSQNYPNPFNPSTEIEYEIPIDCNVTLKVYDLLGREVATLVDEYKQAGSYSSTFSTPKNNGGQAQHLTLSSGIYIYSLQAGPYFKNRKMLLIK